MVISEDSSDFTDRRITIDLLDGESWLELEAVEIEPGEDIEFDISGRITGVDGVKLGRFSGNDVRPAEVQFIVTPSN